MQRALRDALKLQIEYDPRGLEPPPIDVLGPSRSGAATALRRNLEKWEIENPAVPIRVTTGSATNRENASILERYGFRSTVHADTALTEFVREYLTKTLAFEIPQIALLAESATSYGAGFIKPARTDYKDDNSGQQNGNRDRRSWQVLEYPLHISTLRAKRNQSDQSVTKPNLPIQQLLDIDADEHNLPHDVFPPQSVTTPSTVELALHNLLNTIAAQNIEVVIISALESLDAIFLADQVIASFPDVTLVFLSTDILLLHDRLRAFEGSLVASSYPLANSAQLPRSRNRLTRILPSESAQGVFNATILSMADSKVRCSSGEGDSADIQCRWLMGYGRTTENETVARVPSLWMSVIGNGEFWPLRSERPSLASYATQLSSEKSARPSRLPISPHSWVSFSWFSVALLIWSALLIASKAPPSTRRLETFGLRRLFAPLPRYPVQGGRQFLMWLLFFVWLIISIVAVAVFESGRRHFKLGPNAEILKVSLFLASALLLLNLVWMTLELLRSAVAWLFSLLRRHSLFRTHLDDPNPAPPRDPRMVTAAAFAGTICAMGCTTETLAEVPANLGDWADRTQSLFSGCSILAVLVVLALGYSVWCIGYLQQAQLANDFRSHPRRQVGIDDGAVRLTTLTDGQWPRGLSLLTLILCGAILLCWSARVPVFDGFVFRVLASFYFSLLFAFTLFGAARSFAIWRELCAYLAHNGDRFEAALRGIPRTLLPHLYEVHNQHVNRIYSWRRLIAVVASYVRGHVPFQDATHAHGSGLDLCCCSDGPRRHNLRSNVALPSSIASTRPHDREERVPRAERAGRPPPACDRPARRAPGGSLPRVRASAPRLVGTAQPGHGEVAGSRQPA
jgi:hypothetical protein